MKNTRSILLFAFAFITCISLFSCSKGKVENPITVEEELITTLRITVTDSLSNSQSFIYKIESGFGSGSGTPVIDTLKLSPNSRYAVALTVLNEQASPAEDITEEIIAESDEHLFLFQSTPVSGNGSISFTGGNTDGNGAPLNQTIDFLIGPAGSGSLKVTLKHEPTDKTATTPAAAGGATDLQATFPVLIN